MILRRLVNNSYRIGSKEDVSRIVKVIKDDSIPAVVKEEALRLLLLWEKPHPVDPVSGHYRPLAERDSSVLKSVLDKFVPALLERDGFVLGAAIDLIEKYDLSVDELDSGTLKKFIANKELPEDTRLKGLSIYVHRKEQGLAEYLIELSADPSDTLAITALENLVSIAPEKALPALEKAIEGGSLVRAQKAWAAIGKVAGDEAAGFIAKHLVELTKKNGLSGSGVELLAVAAVRSEKSVKDALAAYEKHVAESKDPLTKFNISLEGGDAARGYLLFKSHPAGQCMRCHKAVSSAKAEGGDAGPNLSGIGSAHDRRYLLEALVQPGAAVAPGYGVVSISFKNGATLGGSLIEETADHLIVSTPDKTLQIKRTDITSFTPPVSAMPPMGFMMQAAEIRDLVAWLASLDGPVKKGDGKKPELLDPSTLPGAK